MPSLGQYFMKVIAASTVCGFIKTIIGKNIQSCGIIELLCGIIILCVVISPLADIELRGIYDNYNMYSEEAKANVNAGVQMMRERSGEIIKEQTEEYILQRAEMLDVDIHVDILLNEDQLPYQIAVEGNLSPYKKEILIEYISETLNIPEECQVWKSGS